jgi:hypothetical protein
MSTITEITADELTALLAPTEDATTQLEQFIDAIATAHPTDHCIDMADMLHDHIGANLPIALDMLIQFVRICGGG